MITLYYENRKENFQSAIKNVELMIGVAKYPPGNIPQLKFSVDYFT